MITCPTCKHKEYEGALFCSECGAELIISQNRSSTINIDHSELRQKVINQDKQSKITLPPSELKDSILALKILDGGSMVYIRGRNEFILGRSTEGQTIIPDIDLSSYNAYEKGVSRLHATINIQGENVLIKDLDSANGTWINGKRVDPQKDYNINHGDNVILGQLVFQVLFTSKLES
jgi:pSer/pThr/pTyr-binding forkhead associated (FHA) protein